MLRLDSMKTFAMLALCCLMTLVWSGCDDGSSDDPGFDNVAACEDWLDAVSCGGFDFSSMIDCNAYDVACDVADYFDCLTENTICDEALGVPDTSGWLGCANLQQCD